MTRHDERGATTVIVLLLMVAFIGLAAFAVDISRGFMEKRRESISADAAVVAAARAISDALDPGDACDETTLENLPVVVTTANDFGEANDLSPNSPESPVIDVDCTPTDGDGNSVAGIEVTLRTRESFDTILADTYTNVNELAPPGQASALLFIPTEGQAEGLRPIAACAKRVVHSRENGNEPFLIDVNKTTAVCDSSGDAAGNWGFVDFHRQGIYGEYDRGLGGFPLGAGSYYRDPDCDKDTATDAGCQTNHVDHGYGGPFFFPNTASDDKGAVDGLAGNSGNPSSADAAFKGLAGETILLPVASGFVELGGNNGKLSVTGVMTAYVCAARVGKKPGDIDDSGKADPRCSPWPTPDANASALALPSAGSPERDPAQGGDPGFTYESVWNSGEANQQLLWVVPSIYTTTGSPSVPGAGPGCGFGDTCDQGLRATLLWK